MKKAKVFVSCGQRGEEKALGLEICNLLRDKGFEPYFAEEIQTPEALTQNIFNELKQSEYFISINFKRDETVYGSLFIQQEFAIAAFLEIPMLAFHKGNVSLEGVGKYLILKSIEFNSTKDLLTKVSENITTWDSKSKNQLELSFGNPHANMQLGTAAGSPLSNWFHIIVSNLSSTRYCKNAYAYIESVVDLTTNTQIVSDNDYKQELIWAGTLDVSINIPQHGKRDIDALFCIHGNSNLQFHQRTSTTAYRYPDLNIGKYKIIYIVISDNFPTAKLEAEIAFTAPASITVLNQNQIE